MDTTLFTSFLMTFALLCFGHAIIVSAEFVLVARHCKRNGNLKKASSLIRCRVSTLFRCSAVLGNDILPVTKSHLVLESGLTGPRGRWLCLGRLPATPGQSATSSHDKRCGCQQ